MCYVSSARSLFEAKESPIVLSLYEHLDGFINDVTRLFSLPAGGHDTVKARFDTIDSIQHPLTEFSENAERNEALLRLLQARGGRDQIEVIII